MQQLVCSEKVGSKSTLMSETQLAEKQSVVMCSFQLKYQWCKHQILPALVVHISPTTLLLAVSAAHGPWSLFSFGIGMWSLTVNTSPELSHVIYVILHLVGKNNIIRWLQKKLGCHSPSYFPWHVGLAVVDIMWCWTWCTLGLMNCMLVRKCVWLSHLLCNVMSRDIKILWETGL